MRPAPRRDYANGQREAERHDEQRRTSALQATVLPSVQREAADTTPRFGGEQRKAQNSFIIGFLLALFGIYALVVIPSRFYLHPLAITSTRALGGSVR